MLALYGHTQQRTGGYDMILRRVLTEVLEGIEGFLAFLDFIDEDECLSGKKRDFAVGLKFLDNARGFLGDTLLSAEKCKYFTFFCGYLQR
jgi:hypothetical protein